MGAGDRDVFGAPLRLDALQGYFEIHEYEIKGQKKEDRTRRNISV